jgi:hypothetical protein
MMSVIAHARCRVCIRFPLTMTPDELGSGVARNWQRKVCNGDATATDIRWAVAMRLTSMPAVEDAVCMESRENLLLANYKNVYYFGFRLCQLSDLDVNPLPYIVGYNYKLQKSAG